MPQLVAWFHYTSVGCSVPNQKEDSVMKSFRLALVVVFIAAFSIVACSDDESPTDTGTPDNLNAGNVCDEGICTPGSAAQQDCQDFLDRCLMWEDEDECVGAAWLNCENV